MANQVETCSVYFYNKEKKCEKQPKLHAKGKIILKGTKILLIATSGWIPPKYCPSDFL
jgi:hypothetical protein